MIIPKFTPHGNSFLAALELTALTGEQKIDISNQTVNYTNVEPKSIEINSVLSPQKLTLTLNNRKIILPPYAYAVIAINSKIGFITINNDSTIYDQTIINISDIEKSETIQTFGSSKRVVSKNNYTLKNLQCSWSSGANPQINYSTGQTDGVGNSIAGTPITTPIKISLMDIGRLISIITTDGYKSGVFGATRPFLNIQCYYGFSQETANNPLGQNAILYNAPLFINELWIMFDYTPSAVNNGANSSPLAAIGFETYGD
jgi:hypothetical protein